MSKEHGQRSVATLIAESGSGQVLLPNFQRSYVWKPDDAKSLAASILLGIPCGSLLLIGGTSSDFAARKVGISRSETSPTEYQCDFLLDGQQRASTIRALFSDTFGNKWSKAWGEMFGALKNRWAARVVPAADDPDLFGYRTLRFTGLQPEPDLIAEALVQHNIYKTKGKDSWFHPAFEAKLGENERRLKIAVGAAAAGQIPLWEVGELGASDDGLIKTALQRIAENRRDELLASLKDEAIERDAFADLVRPGETWETLLASGQLRDRLTDRRAEWIQGVLRVFLEAREFRLGTIELTKDELPKAIAIFEAINRGGSPLTPFDLVTARYARGQAANSLPEMIQGRIGICQVK
jgi:hypothetical protein